ncbi:MAG: hypothetical protein UMV23_00635 [Halanaerobium sp.]|nr:hypothetical protein [Halanaerobium sp.]
MEITIWALIIFIFLLLLFSRPYHQWKEHKFSDFLKKAEKIKEADATKGNKEKGRTESEKQVISSTGYHNSSEGKR